MRNDKTVRQSYNVRKMYLAFFFFSFKISAYKYGLEALFAKCSLKKKKNKKKAAKSQPT